MREFILHTFLPACIPLISAGLLWLTARLSQWFHAKAQTSKAFAVAASTYELVRAVVEHVERHLRPELQKRLADGHLTSQEADELKALAMKLTKEALGEHGVAKLQAVFGGGVDLLLSGWIERANREREAAGALLSPK